MKFNERLAKIKAKFQNGETPQAIIDVLNAHVDQLLISGVADRPLKVGSKAPLDYDVESRTQRINLSSLHQTEFLVLSWFRGNW